MIISAPVTPPRNKLIRAAYILIIIALVLLVIGFVAPGWEVYNYIVLSAHIGLWFSVSCVVGICTTHSLINTDLDDVDTPFQETFLAYRIESSLAVAIAIASLILVVTIRKPSFETNKTLIIVAAITSCVSGSLTIVAAASNGYRIGDLRVVGNTFITFPYATFVFSIGGVLMLIDTILLSVHCVRLRRSPEDDIHVERPRAMDYVTQQIGSNPPIPHGGYGGNAYPGNFEDPRYNRSNGYHQDEPRYHRSSGQYPEHESHNINNTRYPDDPHYYSKISRHSDQPNYSRSSRYSEEPHYSRSRRHDSDYHRSSAEQSRYEDSYARAPVHYGYSSSKKY